MMIAADDLNFLREMARDVIEASRVRPAQRIEHWPANALGFTAIKPGGREDYPSVWVRDFSMSLDCGLIAHDDIARHFELFKEKQNGPAEKALKTGGVIPPYAVVDHVAFDGSAIFYPGAYDADKQGGEPFGVLPPIDDHFEFVHIAHHLKRTAEDAVTRAFHAVEHDPKTGLVGTSPHRRAVGFGFCDTVYLTGSLLFPSLLRYRAARELGLDEAAQTIATHLVPVFADEQHRHGWLYAATDVGHQPDVWGTLYALHLGVLPKEFATVARNTVADALTRGTIEYEGAVRHVPTDFDFSPTTAWQKVAWDWKVNTYQNGGYWHTPTGWLVSTLHESHPELARQVLDRYLKHLREGDFRRGPQFGAPWECFGRDGKDRQNPVYMTSVTVPLAVLQQLEG